MHEKGFRVQNMRNPVPYGRVMVRYIVQSIDRILKDGRTACSQVHLVNVADSFQKFGVMQLRGRINKSRNLRERSTFAIDQNQAELIGRQRKQIDVRPPPVNGAPADVQQSSLQFLRIVFGFPGGISLYFQADAFDGTGYIPVFVDKSRLNIGCSNIDGKYEAHENVSSVSSRVPGMIRTPASSLSPWPALCISTDTPLTFYLARLTAG
jgi:hypothetical protein